MLQKTVQRLKKDKLDFFVGGPEFEFFIFKLDENGSPTNKPSDYGGGTSTTPRWMRPTR